MTGRKVALVALAVFLLNSLVGSTDIQAQTNSVVVESKEVLPGATNVTIGVYISNAVTIYGMALPLEFRSLNGGAYVQFPIIRGLNSAGRMLTSPLGTSPDVGPPASIVSTYYLFPVSPGCSGPESHTYQIPSQQPEAISPDGFLFATISTGEDAVDPSTIGLPPGTETPGVDPPSFRFVVSITNVEGQFEIDTCCVTPANHLLFVDQNSSPILPSFTKGIISVGCFCRCHADPECDGMRNIVDVVKVINTAFRDAPGSKDEDCTRSRTDIDDSGVTDIFDVTQMVRVVFGGESAEAVFTNPCD